MSAAQALADQLPPLILASSSIYRAQVAAESGLVMRAIAPQVDERALDAIGVVCGARVLAGALALAKAESVRSRLLLAPGLLGRENAHQDPPFSLESGAIIVAADQVGERLSSDGTSTILTKSASAEDARSALIGHSNTTIRLTNGLVAMDALTGEWSGCFDTHSIDMEAISAEAAEGYVERCKPFDCVGAYRIEDGQTYPQWNFVTEIRGDSGFDGIMGLPIEALRALVARVAHRPFA